MTEQQLYQHFRMASVIEEVCVRTTTTSNSNDGPSCYVGLEDVRDVFPNALRFKLDGLPIPFLINIDGTRIEPLRIAFYPDKTLDVVLSTAAEQVHVDTSMSTPNPEFETILHQLGGLHDQGQTTQEIVKQVMDGLREANNRLILIQSKTDAILTQNYELLEYTIPRLFIVLPEELTSWNPTSMICTKFRLHFICECGEHTKSHGSNIPHHLHLANHEGYVINKPTEFFKKYGPFLMLMLEMIKLGTSFAGHVVPAIATLKLVDALDFAKSSVGSVTSKVIKGVDYSLKYLEESRSLAEKLALGGDLGSYLTGVEGLEGVELRQLGSYLEANNSDNLLGNLYRMTTKDGHVKWVCRHHYRAGYHEAHTQKLRDVVNLAGGVFDEQLGGIKVALKSSFAAAEFYEAIGKAKAGVYDLDITFDWDCSKTDLEAFAKEGALALSEALKTNTVLTTLNLQHNSIGNEGALALSEAFKTNTTLTTLNLDHNSISKEGSPALSEALKTNTTLSTLNLEHKSIEMGKDLVLCDALNYNTTLVTLTTLNLRNRARKERALALLEAFKANTTLTTLNLHEGALALSEALKTNATLTTLNLQTSSIGKEGALALSEALKTNITLTALNLKENSIGMEGAFALSEALKTNTTLTTLNLWDNSLGNEGALALSEALKTNTTLTTLNLRTNSIGNEGALALSEALKASTTLTALNLMDNSIGKEGALALSEALKTNTSLTTLDLRGSSIENEESLALTEALKTNTTLTTLNM
ncbi:hypothetical protein EDD21DRAFT_407542 [Dissophora ornata]|nr:hypothetical protein EDD21DRAFT_407542 [Dissophora ornata]